MPQKFNPWLLVMFGAPLLVLTVPFLVRGRQQIHVPSGEWLLNIAQGLFYLVTIGGGLGLMLRSVWGASGEQSRKIVGVLCVVGSLLSTLVLSGLGPMMVPVVICGVAFGLLLIGGVRK